MFEKILLEKIGTDKFRFYKQRTKKNNYITVNRHSSEWWENEFDRLLNIFIY